MSDQLPPDLEDKEPPFAADSTTEPGSETGVIGGTETPTLPEDEEKYFIRIDKRTLAKDIDRLEAEIPEFAQVYHSKIGNKAARKYQPQIEQLTREKQQAEQTAFKHWVQALPEPEITKLYNSDPNFARAYTELVHQNPQVIAAQQQAEAVKTQVTQQIDSIFDWAETKGLPESKIDEFRKAIFEEKKYDQLGVNEAISKLNSEVHDALLEHLTPKTAPPTTTPAPQVQQQPNSALLSGSANTGKATARNGSGPKWTADQVRNMTPAQMLQHFPGENDYDNAVNSGLIEGLEANPFTKR